MFKPVKEIEIWKEKHDYEYRKKEIDRLTDMIAWTQLKINELDQLMSNCDDEYKYDNLMNEQFLKERSLQYFETELKMITSHWESHDLVSA